MMGTTYKVSTVAYVSPPMVTMAKGWIASAPIPTPTESVDKPRIVVRAVMRMGRRRVRPVCTKASLTVGYFSLI